MRRRSYCHDLTYIDQLTLLVNVHNINPMGEADFAHIFIKEYLQ